MSDSQVVVAAVSIGIFVATVSALLWYGPKAAMVVLLIAVIGLTLAVDSLFRRAEVAEGTADEALALGDNHTEEIVTLRAEVEELRGWCVTVRQAFEADTDDLAWEPETQPIQLPEPQGPPTEPVTEVAARQVRALMEEGVEMVERTYVVDGVQRTFRLRAVKEDA